MISNSQWKENASEGTQKKVFYLTMQIPTGYNKTLQIPNTFGATSGTVYLFGGMPTRDYGGTGYGSYVFQKHLYNFDNPVTNGDLSVEISGDKINISMRDDLYSYFGMSPVEMTPSYLRLAVVNEC